MMIFLIYWMFYSSKQVSIVNGENNLIFNIRQPDIIFSKLNTELPYLIFSAHSIEKNFAWKGKRREILKCVAI